MHWVLGGTPHVWTYSNTGIGGLILSFGDPNEAGHSAAMGSRLYLVRNNCLVHVPWYTQSQTSLALTSVSHETTSSGSPWGALINCTNRAGIPNPTLVLLCSARTPHHGKMLYAVTLNKRSKFKCTWGRGCWVTRIPSCYVRRQRKSFSWKGGKEGTLKCHWHALWTQASLVLPYLKGSGYRIWSCPQDRERVGGHLILGSWCRDFFSDFTYMERKKEGREGEWEKMHSVAQALHVLKLYTYLFLCFSSLLCLSSFLSSHAKMHSDRRIF